MTTPNDKPSEMEIQRFDPALLEASVGMFSLTMDPSTQGDWVYHSDHLAALAAARADARREALEEAADQVKCLISCVNAGPRNDGEEWFVVDTLEDAMSAIRALLTPTPQGETKEQQP